VPLNTVETALLLGSLRRLIRPPDAPRLAPIRSLAYFRPVIEELQENPAPANYRDYLRLKLRQAIKVGTAVDQKTTFSGERSTPASSRCAPRSLTGPSTGAPRAR
jgi:hypothetical protein